jgi:hypothetical protein
VVFTLVAGGVSFLGFSACGKNEFEGTVHADHSCPGFGHRRDVRQTFGASMAIGAFLAGWWWGVLTSASVLLQKHCPCGMRFAVLFFVSVRNALRPTAPC